MPGAFIDNEIPLKEVAPMDAKPGEPVSTLGTPMRLKGGYWSSPPPPEARTHAHANTPTHSCTHSPHEVRRPTHALKASLVCRDIQYELFWLVKSVTGWRHVGGGRLPMGHSTAYEACDRTELVSPPPPPPHRALSPICPSRSIIGLDHS